MSLRPLIRLYRQLCGSAGTGAGGRGHPWRRISQSEKTYIASYIDTLPLRIYWTHKIKSIVPGALKKTMTRTTLTDDRLDGLARHFYQRTPSPAHEIRDPRLLYGMQRLSPHQLNVLECHVYGMLTFRQIGDLLEMDPHQIRISYVRALANIRRTLVRKDALEKVVDLRSKNYNWPTTARMLGVHVQTAQALWYEARRAPV